MIRLNWKELKDGTKGDIGKIIQYLTNIYVLKGTMYNYIERNKWAKNIYTRSLKLPNFICNIDGFIENSVNADQFEQLICLELMAMRDVFTYLNTKGRVNFIPIWKVSDRYDIEKLKTNRLLMIEDNNIYFVYEGDYYDGNSI